MNKYDFYDITLLIITYLSKFFLTPAGFKSNIFSYLEFAGIFIIEGL